MIYFFVSIFSSSSNPFRTIEYRICPIDKSIEIGFYRYVNGKTGISGQSERLLAVRRQKDAGTRWSPIGFLYFMTRYGGNFNGK